jgi:beta-carotene hydroxylase
MHTPPPLEQLGLDLVGTAPWRRRLALARPALGLGAYALAAATGHWLAACAALFLVFTTVISLMHDAVHGALGLRRRGTDLALFLAGALLMVSGHAYRMTHHQHHRVFPGPDDPEGEAAAMSPGRALLDGPVHVARIWLWSLRRTRRRGWLVAEAVVPFAAFAAGIALLPLTPAPIVYVAAAVGGGWLYPLLTVRLPHAHPGDEPVLQARTLRGRIVPVLLLEQTYHLEHHLYPRVPSHKLPELARRLDPFLRSAGVTPRRVL